MQSADLRALLSAKLHTVLETANSRALAISKPHAVVLSANAGTLTAAKMHSHSGPPKPEALSSASLKDVANAKSLRDRFGLEAN